MAWSKPVWIDGMKFDSGKEGARYLELKLLQYAGEISDLETQPQFILQSEFKDAHSGKKVDAITYRADFRFCEKGKVIIEEVKGANKRGKALMTEASRLRFKMAQYQNQDMEFRLIAI
jgi:hypothetical protein